MQFDFEFLLKKEVQKTSSWNETKSSDRVKTNKNQKKKKFQKILLKFNGFKNVFFEFFCNK